jgi:hypothetical protein
MQFDETSGLYTSDRLLAPDLELHHKVWTVTGQVNRLLAYDAEEIGRGFPLPDGVEEGLRERAKLNWTCPTIAMSAEILYNLPVSYMGTA